MQELLAISNPNITRPGNISIVTHFRVQWIRQDYMAYIQSIRAYIQSRATYTFLQQQLESNIYIKPPCSNYEIELHS